jgi:AcrR family transcriptional regulator
LSPDTSALPGTLRPRGRTERVRQAVVDATRTLLLTEGYRELTVERVAELAGVAKSTVYRRWRDTAGLLLELLTELSAVEIPLVDTGSVDEDLLSLARGIAHVYTETNAGPMVLALIAESVQNERVADGLREFWQHRNDTAAESIRRAVERGDLPADTDPVEVIRVLGAPFYYRMLVTHEPLDDELARRAAGTALAAARAGELRKREP